MVYFGGQEVATISTKKMYMPKYLIKKLIVIIIVVTSPTDLNYNVQIVNELHVSQTEA